MFPRIGTMHLAAEQLRYVALPTNGERPSRRLPFSGLKWPKGLRVLLRLAGVMAIVIGGMVLAVWVAE